MHEIMTEAEVDNVQFREGKGLALEYHLVKHRGGVNLESQALAVAVADVQVTRRGPVPEVGVGVGGRWHEMMLPCIQSCQVIEAGLGVVDRLEGV